MTAPWCPREDCTSEQVHQHCSSCGTHIFATGQELCTHHHRPDVDDWARANRVYCDLIHRGIMPPPVNLHLTDADLITTGWEGTQTWSDT